VDTLKITSGWCHDCMYVLRDVEDKVFVLTYPPSPVKIYNISTKISSTETKHSMKLATICSLESPHHQ